MTRPKAGHGSTSFKRGNKTIKLIGNTKGQWVPSGIASTWPRCIRCRKPEDQLPDGKLCVHCFYYKSPERNATWFWAHKNDYLFPYNIGRRIMNNRLNLSKLSDLKINWREYLRSLL